MKLACAEEVGVGKVSIKVEVGTWNCQKIVRLGWLKKKRLNLSSEESRKVGIEASRFCRDISIQKKC
jgi:hypothetical protein